MTAPSTETLHNVQLVLRQLESTERKLHENWCVSKDTGRFLQILTAQSQASRILEVGTSIGYSALNFSAGCLRGIQNHPESVKNTNWSIHTIDASEDRTKEAKGNFKEAGIDSHITCYVGQALNTLATILTHVNRHPEETYDIIFLDARKSEYIEYLKFSERLLKPCGLLIADNTQSHRAQMADFIDTIHASANWLVSDVDSSSGFILGYFQPKGM